MSEETVSNFMSDLTRITDASPRWRACLAVFVSHEGNFMLLSSPDPEHELDFVRAAVDRRTGHKDDENVDETPVAMEDRAEAPPEYEVTYRGAGLNHRHRYTATALGLGEFTSDDRGAAFENAVDACWTHRDSVTTPKLAQAEKQLDAIALTLDCAEEEHPDGPFVDDEHCPHSLDDRVDHLRDQRNHAERELELAREQIVQLRKQLEAERAARSRPERFFDGAQEYQAAQNAPGPFSPKCPECSERRAVPDLRGRGWWICSCGKNFGAAGGQEAYWDSAVAMMKPSSAAPTTESTTGPGSVTARVSGANLFHVVFARDLRAGDKLLLSGAEQAVLGAGDRRTVKEARIGMNDATVPRQMVSVSFEEGGTITLEPGIRCNVLRGGHAIHDITRLRASIVARKTWGASAVVESLSRARSRLPDGSCRCGRPGCMGGRHVYLVGTVGRTLGAGHSWREAFAAAGVVLAPSNGAGDESPAPGIPGSTAAREVELVPGGRVFCRYQPADELDEVFVTDPRHLHVEVMGNKHIWAGVMLEGRRMIHLNFWIDDPDELLGGDDEDELDPKTRVALRYRVDLDFGLTDQTPDGVQAVRTSLFSRMSDVLFALVPILPRDRLLSAGLTDRFDALLAELDSEKGPR